MSGVRRQLPSDAIRAWETIHVDLQRHHCRKPTVRLHRYTWFAFCAFLGPRRRLSRVTERDLDRFLARPVADPRGAKGPTLSPASQHTYAAAICGDYQRLVAARLLRRNPLAGYVLPRVEEGPPRDLPADIVGGVLTLAAEDDRDLALVMLAWGQGLRIGSIAAARIEHVDLRGDGSLFVRAKGGRTGTVPLAPLVLAFLRGYLDGRPTSGPLICSRGAGRASQHLTAGYVGQLLTRLLRAAGSTETPHAFRHTFATWLLAARHGENIRAVQQLMLHATLRSTERYTKGYNRDAWDAIRLLPDPRQVRPRPEQPEQPEQPEVPGVPGRKKRAPPAS